MPPTNRRPANDLGYLCHKRRELPVIEQVLFEFAKPRTVVLTTPNREYNVTWETLPAGQFRHPDHSGEWTRQEFQDWATGIAGRFGCVVRFLPVGTEHEKR